MSPLDQELAQLERQLREQDAQLALVKESLSTADSRLQLHVAPALFQAFDDAAERAPEPAPPTLPSALRA